MFKINLRKLILPCLFSALLVTTGWGGSAAERKGKGEEETTSVQSGGKSRQEILQEKRREKANKLVPYQISKGEEKFLRKIEKQPFLSKLLGKGHGGVRLLIGGMPSGSGFAGGIGYQNGIDRDNVFFTFDARYSTRQYEQLDAMIEFPTKRSERPVRAFVKAGYLDYKEVNFFGIGNDSSENNETSFRIEERSISAGVTIDAHRLVRFEGHLGYIDTGIFPGEVAPSLEDTFDPFATPGFFRQPEYFTYGGQVSLNFRDRGTPPVGVGFQFEVERFDERSANLFNYTRYTGEFQANLPLGYRNRRLAFRARTSHSLPDAGQQVPFYRLETIGGSKTLRGFREYRFRDLRNLLLNLEYRWEAFRFADMALFADGGKVFSRAGDLDFTDLHASYGIGILIRAPTGFRLRIDLARSNEGIRIHIGAGPRF